MEQTPTDNASAANGLTLNNGGNFIVAPFSLPNPYVKARDSNPSTRAGPRNDGLHTRMISLPTPRLPSFATLL